MFGIRGIRLKVWLSNYYVLKNNNKICPRNSTIIIMNYFLDMLYGIKIKKSTLW